MKKILLSLLVALCLCSTATARGFKTIAFGAKAGANFSTVTGLADVIGPMKANFTGGFTFEFRPIKWIGLSAELAYTGSSFSTQLERNGAEFLGASYHFIDVPIMARIYVFAGLSVNVGIQASYLFSPTLNIGEMREQFDEGKAVFSVPLGLSYSFRFGLSIEARYTIGLTDIMPGFSYQTTHGNLEIAAIRSQNLAVTVGWRIFGI